jgi:hypothetical protein
MEKRDIYLFAGVISLVLAGFWFVRINNPVYIAEKKAEREEKERIENEKAEERRQNYEDNYTQLTFYWAPVGKWTPGISPPLYSYSRIGWTGKKLKMRVTQAIGANLRPDDWQIVLDDKNPPRNLQFPGGDFYFMSLDSRPQLVLILNCHVDRCVDGIRNPTLTFKKYRTYYEKNTRLQTVTAPVGAWSQIPVPILIHPSGFWVNWEHAGKVKMRITPTPHQPAIGPHDFQTTLIPGKGKNFEIADTGNMYFMSLENKPIDITVRQCPQSVCPPLWAEWLKS